MSEGTKPDQIQWGDFTKRGMHIVPESTRPIPHQQAVRATNEQKSNRPQAVPNQYSAKGRDIISRRGALGRILGGIAAIGAAGLSAYAHIQNPPKPEITAVTPESQTPEESTAASAESEADKVHIKKLNAIMALDPGPERLRSEQDYVNESSTLEQIDAGLMIIRGLEERRALREKRKELRREGKGLKPLSHNLVRFASAQDIDLETIGICADNYQIQKDIIEKLNNSKVKIEITPTTQRVEPTSANMTLNPGGMAALVEFTSAEFLDTGTYFSGTAIKDPVEKAALKEICANVNAQTGLTLDPEKIPCKASGEIGIGLLPSQIIKAADLMKKVGVNANPFDVNSGVQIAAVLFAMNGYKAGDTQSLEIAIKKLHPLAPTQSKIKKAEGDYVKDILQQPKQY